MRRVLTRCAVLLAFAAGATALLASASLDPTPTAEASGCSGKCGR